MIMTLISEFMAMISGFDRETVGLDEFCGLFSCFQGVLDAFGLSWDSCHRILRRRLRRWMRI